jgi:ubiquinone/menaquinone biosynthesis C-methylase UbiE
MLSFLIGTAANGVVGKIHARMPVILLKEDEDVSAEKPIVQSYYDRNVEHEWGRLDNPLGRIEFASTLRLIEQHFPHSAHVCDIGGGPGRYTIELLKRGYPTTLVDFSEEEIAYAQHKIAELKLQANGLWVADACDLHMLGDTAFDAALSLGPMYHIVDPNNRITALHELRRILKPQGIATVAYLNSWGLLRTGVNDFPQRFETPAFPRSLLGERVWSGNELSGFTECYWSTPPLALTEVQQAGFEVVTYIGAEGFASGLGPQLEHLMRDNPAAYNNVVQMGAETSELPQYRDACDHLHIVVRKR